jgi:hypothetical protein
MRTLTFLESNPIRHQKLKKEMDQIKKETNIKVSKLDKIMHLADHVLHSPFLTPRLTGEKNTPNATVNTKILRSKTPSSNQN